MVQIVFLCILLIVWCSTLIQVFRELENNQYHRVHENDAPNPHYSFICFGLLTFYAFLQFNSVLKTSNWNQSMVVDVGC